LKQTKLRKRRVTRYAILYFSLFVFFMALVIAPAVLGNQLTGNMKPLSVAGLRLQQPVNWNNNDTSGLQTGTGNATNDMATETGSSSGAASTDSSSSVASGSDDAAAAEAAAAAAGARLVRRIMFSY
jgi:1,3-beta-glucan synthase